MAVVRDMHRDMDSSCDSRDDWETLMELEEALAGWLIQGSDWHWGPRDDPYQDEDLPAVSLYKDSTKEYATSLGYTSRPMFNKMNENYINL